MRFCNSVDENFINILLLMLAIASQKLVSQISSPYKSLHNNRDIFFDEMVLDFFYERHCKASCKKIKCCLLSACYPCSISLKEAMTSRPALIFVSRLGVIQRKSNEKFDLIWKVVILIKDVITVRYRSKFEHGVLQKFTAPY